MKFKKWILKEVNRATDSIIGLCIGALATVGAISLTNVKAGIVIMVLLVMALYLERN